jgi:phosphoribosylaminoimidazolecarboxamide formyltransferase/IMP cyclohydrolase
VEEAFSKAYACDPVSIFGGIVAANTKIDAPTADRLAELFLEIVVAPAYDDDALAILKKKKNLRIMTAERAPEDKVEIISIDGGLLAQSVDRKLLDKWETVTKTQAPDDLTADMVFGMRVVTFVKSNAIVVVGNRSALGVGGGETNRIWAAEEALARAAANAKAQNLEPPRVMASDAFFPFPDVVEAAAAAGIKAIIQPGGSINDAKSIEACDKLGIAMVFTGARHFKH